MRTWFVTIMSSALIAFAALSSQALAQQKTVKACQDEWRANRAENQAKGITLKAYVAQCRTSGASAEPTTAPAPAGAKSAPTTVKGRGATAPAPKPAPTATTTPTGANQFSTEAQAKARCPSDTIVWVNLDSGIYHFAGYRDYGRTKKGAYICEKDTTTAGFRAAKNEKHP